MIKAVDVLDRFEAGGFRYKLLKKLTLRLGLAVIGLVAFPGRALSQSSDVVWTNMTGVGFDGVTHTLTKTGPNTAWDAGAVSLQALEQEGFVEFTPGPGALTLRRVCGISRRGSGPDASNIDYGVYLDNNQFAWASERGSLASYLGGFGAGDVFRIEVGVGQVRYRKNGVVLYVSQLTQSLPQLPLVAAAAFYDTGATIGNARIGEPSWIHDVGISISDRTLTKTGTSGWNAGGASAKAIEFGDGFVEFTANETTRTRVLGLSHGDAGQNPNDINFGISLNSNGTVNVVENGTSQGNPANYSTGDRFRVELSGGTVKYLQNGALLYSSLLTPQYPLRADAALFDPGATLQDIVIVPHIWTNLVDVSVSGSSLTKTGSPGWGSGASSTASLSSGDGYVEFSATEVNTNRMAGLSATNANHGIADIDFAIALTSGGNVQVYEHGVLVGTYGTYAFGDRFRVEVDGVVKYRMNGVVFYMNTTTLPTYPLYVNTSLNETGATLTDVLMGNLAWKSDAGVFVIANGLARTAPGSDWGSSGAIVTMPIASGDGGLEWVATETSTYYPYRVLGLSTDSSSHDFSVINFGIELLPYATAQVVPGFTTTPYAPGDHFSVAIESGTVTYRKNGTVFATSATAPTYPLWVHATLYSNPATGTIGATLAQVRAWGLSPPTQVATPTMAPPAGTYNVDQSITMRCSTTGAVIHYTTDGITDPTENSPTYTDTVPISVTVTTTLKAKAFRIGLPPSATATATYTLKLPAPTMTNPPPGLYSTTVSPTLTSRTGSRIYYTTNGDEPSDSSPTWVTSGGTVSVSQSLTLKAKAYLSGWSPSDTTTGIYTLKVATPSLSLASGAYTGTQSVTVNGSPAGVQLRFTTTGLEPTINDSSVSPGGTVTVDHSLTLKVKGFVTGWTTSDTAEATYLLTLGTVATPTMTPPGGTYGASQRVTLQTATSGATIRYTQDGGEPTLFSPSYSGVPVSVNFTQTLKAKAFKVDSTPSATATGNYSLDIGTVQTPLITPGTGAYGSIQTVTMTSGTPGATIYYTLTGVDPTTSDSPYTAPITISRSLRLKAKAFKDGTPPSGVAVADYFLNGSLAAGVSHSLAVSGDHGYVWAWGSNGSGELGQGNTVPSNSPVKVKDPTDPTTFLTGVVAVAAGYTSSLALKSNGTVQAWGVGYGTTPVAVPVLTNVVAIAAGWGHNLALTRDGLVFGWGINQAGQLGDGTTNPHTTPAPVLWLTGVTAISAGVSHSLALKTDGGPSGSIWAFGNNNYGQLGDGTNTQWPTPIEVGGLSGVVSISAGWYHSLAVKDDGTGWGWGLNDLGQIGDGTTQPRLSAVQVGGLARAMAMGGGWTFSLALKKEETVWSWGSNASGELGDGTTTSRTTPAEIPWLSKVVGLAVGPNHGLALREDGSIWTWGLNASGQLGDGTNTSRGIPMPIPGFNSVDQSWLDSDPDGDGLSTRLELQLGSDPMNPDTNGDGIPDGAAYAMGISLTDPDMDHDGVDNRTERRNGTDPFRPDTDDDMYWDGPGIDGTHQVDCFPLDRTRHDCPSPTGIRPHITLTEPTNATIISINPPP